MDKRLQTLENWLTTKCQLTLNKLTPASADASFRRYFRAFTADGTFVVMDAPPDKEPLSPFLEVCDSLRELQLHAPLVHHYDRELGFILLEDLGDTTYFDVLPKDADELYEAALQVLVKLQSAQLDRLPYQPPRYDEAKLRTEMNLFPSWFLNKHLGAPMPEQSHAVWLHTQQILVANCLRQPQVWVHRDFHSRNLMRTESASPGIIDFQDAVVGPLSYDAVSLLKDCYIEWPRNQQLHWLESYYQTLEENQLAEFDFAQLVRWFDLTGLQRHLKVLGIFCRLNYRDHKAHYLNDLPLVARYVLDVLPRYAELSAFSDHFAHHIEAVK